MGYGIIYFEDGHTEVILGYVKSTKSGIYELHTCSGIYHMHIYVHESPSGFHSIRHKYFKETDDGSFVYAQIDKVVLI